jgi:alanine racemase
MMAVDLSPLEHVPAVGELVTLWGQGLPLEEVAAFTQNITYTILTAVQNRVKFVWDDTPTV